MFLLSDPAYLHGLQYFDLKLIGAVASYLHGSAFTIRKLGKQDGTTRWSAPCFLQMHQIGLGLTVGEWSACCSMSIPKASILCINCYTT